MVCCGDSAGGGLLYFLCVLLFEMGGSWHLAGVIECVSGSIWAAQHLLSLFPEGDVILRPHGCPQLDHLGTDQKSHYCDNSSLRNQDVSYFLIP
jgi:hypothetical protein